MPNSPPPHRSFRRSTLRPLAPGFRWGTGARSALVYLVQDRCARPGAWNEEDPSAVPRKP